jgi:anti-sigma B factor antagonist
VELGMTTSTVGEATVLSLAGEIDIQSAPGLVSRLEELDSEGARRVVVDLSAVDFLDSSALGALIAAHRSISGAGRSLCVACPKPHISKIFRITRVSDVIDLYDSVEDAVADPR